MEEETGRDIWRGRISTQVENIEKTLELVRAEMVSDHQAMRALISRHADDLDARLKPLEQLRLILLGIGMALAFLVPAIWLYASRINALLDKVQKLLPDTVGK